jgi:16S rRNA (adenine1518-N6/adenine1519-N6)-dimethyltransferase
VNPRRPPARKRLGQHFLEAAWADKVVDAIDPHPGDRFIEIGPGLGALTTRLAARVRQIIAFEVDRDLAARLRPELPPTAEVVVSDFLDVDIGRFVASGPVRVAGNLPYNVSSPILFHLLDASRRYDRLIDATIMLQLEVADRLVAEVGTKAYGVLTILTALAADVTRLLTLPPGAFRPIPKVRSAVVRLRFRPPRVQVADPVLLERLVRSVFTLRRKTLLNALRPFAESLGRDAGAALPAAAIDPGRRPETLSVEEFGRLAGVLSSAYP